MFPTVEFKHATMFGTYWVPCEVLDKTDRGYTIKFRDELDELSDEEVIYYRVPDTYLKFPAFSELIV